MVSFSKKEYLKLKAVFGKETQFSQWLATEGLENIKQALGVELITKGTEVKPNNQFSTDILLSVDPQYTKGSPDKIVIENQYGVTDHNHFSKLITYAVSNEAKYAVWIAEEIHPEHKKAIDWLNENTNDNINFYLYKAVIEKIGDSEPCFELIPVCEPNEEQKVKMSKGNSDPSELKLTQLKFWTHLSLKINEKTNLPYKARKPQPHHWYDISIGSSKCHISICLLSLEQKIRFDLWISDDKGLYDSLSNVRNDVEKEIGQTLIWDRKDGAKASSISYEILNGFDIYDESKYDFYAEEIIKEINEHFYKFEKLIKTF